MVTLLRFNYIVKCRTNCVFY